MDEALNLILSELKEMRGGINGLNQGQQRLEAGQQRLESRIDGLEGRMDRLEVGQQQLDGRMDRLEVGQKELRNDIVEHLGAYTEKMANHFDQTAEVLNKRVFKVETEVERLCRHLWD